jgi:hypothetical protein
MQLNLFDDSEYQVKSGDFFQLPSLYPEVFELLQDRTGRWWALSEHGYLSRCSPRFMIEVGFVKANGFK